MLRIERRNVEGLGSKEMAFDKLMIAMVCCCMFIHTYVVMWYFLGVGKVPSYIRSNLLFLLLPKTQQKHS